MLKELQIARYFDCFAHNATTTKWACFACNHPDRVKTFLRQDSNNPVLEGQLKEKRGRWKFFKRWHTKYFTLSSAALSCREQGSNVIDKFIIDMIYTSSLVFFIFSSLRTRVHRPLSICEKFVPSNRLVAGRRVENLCPRRSKFSLMTITHTCSK